MMHAFCTMQVSSDMLKLHRDHLSWLFFLTVSGLREVHISVSEGSAGDHVSADPDGEHRSGWAELLIEHRLRDVGVQVANVERSHRITPGRCVHILDFTLGMNARFSPQKTPEKKEPV